MKSWIILCRRLAMVFLTLLLFIGSLTGFARRKVSADEYLSWIQAGAVLLLFIYITYIITGIMNKYKIVKR